MSTDPTLTRLVKDTLRKNIIEDVPLFKAKQEAYIWTCALCKPNSEHLYKLNVPPISEEQKVAQVKALVRKHVELHYQDILSRFSPEELRHYEVESREKSPKRVKLWTNGTICDRKLYEENPF